MCSPHRGKERCRHFVINQLPNGELVVSGDICSHDSLPALISHYQTSPIQPFGEKLIQSYVKFSDHNIYDEITPGQPAKREPKTGLRNSSTAERESVLSALKPPTLPPKSQRGFPRPSAQGSGEGRGPCAEDFVPPLPERNHILLNTSLQRTVHDDEMYSKPTKYMGDRHEMIEPDRSPNKTRVCSPCRLGDVAKKKQKDANARMYSPSRKVDVFYSLVKKTQLNQKSIVATKTPKLLYSEVDVEHRQSLPESLGHLKSVPQSTSMSQEAMKLSLDTGSRTPRLVTNVKELSDYEVVEMKFATSFQCADGFKTLDNKLVDGPLLRERVGETCGLHWHAKVSESDLPHLYEQIPFRGLRPMTEHHGLDQLSKISLSCTTTYDHISTVSTCTANEITTGHLYEKIQLPNPLQENTYESVGRGILKAAGKKQIPKFNLESCLFNQLQLLLAAPREVNSLMKNKDDSFLQRRSENPSGKIKIKL
ncbi:uncharacterized protein LOC142469205 [Ascaphus truei]|uniref:uncharacterized protein LOC142469205 n=1 Tax=Ascaphus truei TaxID=8439 RepID=UPI003F597BC8